MHTHSAKHFSQIPLSILDLAPINEESDAGQSYKNSVELARHVEGWGFNRYWLAEHHNMPGIASSATSVVIGHIAGATERIRVGAGGIMLPNHASLVIAEQFGTLESMYPGRIDLGLGRAPGTDQATARALARSINSRPDLFPQQVEELEQYISLKMNRLVCVLTRGQGSIFPSGCSVQVDLVPSWRPKKDSLFPLPVIFHPIILCQL